MIRQNPKGILLLTGTVGTGKTTSAIEIIEQLADMGLPCAVIDLDWLGWINVGADFHEYETLIAQNVISVWPNYHALGVKYLVLARGFTQREPVQTLKKAFPDTPMTIVRLIASKETITMRLTQRDSGETLREHLEELNEMDRIMDELQLEDEIIITDAVSVKNVAQQIVNLIDWK